MCSVSSYYEKILATGEMKCIDEEIPFDVPQGWEWCRLRDIIQLLSGRDLEPSKYSTSQKGIPYITGASNFDKENLIINRWTQNPVTISEKGDLLITCKGTIGSMAFNNIGSVHIARQIMTIKSDSVNLHYLKLYLELNLAVLESQANSMIPGISRDIILNCVVPIPPIEEENRIVEKVYILMPLVNKYSSSQKELFALNKMINDKLRKSILQEVIQGKLVPQIAEEGTAQELLEQIKAEKQKLVKEGKLKKSALNDSVIFRGDDNKYYEQVGKSITEITEEIPFSIPDSWTWSRLSGVVKIIMGQSPDGNDVFEAEKEDNAYEFHQGKIYFTEKYISPSGKWCKNPPRIANIGSLLICVRAPIGDVNIVQRQIGIGRGLAAIIGYAKIKTDFLYYWILAHKKNLIEKGTGSTFKAITLDVLKDMIIPIPPLAEQKRLLSRIELLYDKIEGN